MAETPMRYVRISDELWDKAQARAEGEKVHLSELIRLWLTLYADYDASMTITDELVKTLTAICRRIIASSIPGDQK